jgi:UDP-N-acetylmuramate--alanine ligase
MKDLKDIKKVYLLGIGGIGMSALARYFKGKGAKVSGYDKTSSPLTDQLIEEGIEVRFDESSEGLDEADLFIYTPAVPIDHIAFGYVQATGNEWFKRSEVLEWITKETKTIAIAGTHGKTTTTGITAHLLHETRGDIAAFVGGVMTGYNSNLITTRKPNYVVVEADEYDRSFLRLHPDIAVITSLDPDHLDIYGAFEEMKKDYKTFASRAELLIVHEDIAEMFDHPNKRIYGKGQRAEVRYGNVEVVDGAFRFNINEVQQYVLKLAGEHNVENATAAIAVAEELKVKSEQSAKAIGSFAGIKRRFERILETPTRVVIDDYAHHPEEIKAALSAARMLYAGRKVGVIFQPHLFTRTRDLEQGFVESLSEADEVILLPIYPARERPIEGVSSENLLNKLTLKTKQLVQKSDLVNAVLSLNADVVLILGAGDIDRFVQPIANAIKTKSNVE